MYKQNSWVILIPIWGNAHINMCAQYLLPSLLAPGNMPFLATADRIIVRFLTTTPSSGNLKALKIYPALAALATIEFCFIDDLVSAGNYGLTLTMAYERGIQTDPEDKQTENRYIFLNGDFVLSNNTFTTLSNKFAAGFKAIVSPSLRATEENVIDALQQTMLKQNGIIDCNARDLVKLALDNLHPTVISGLLNNSKVRTGVSHQFFYRASNDILLARFFLVFMLCIKPEQPIKMLTSHCDYSLIPELCPSGNYAVITDSDDAFLLELSPFEQESDHISLGDKNPLADANRMLAWVTKEQADYSTKTLYFHAADIPTNDTDIELGCKTLDTTLNKIYATLNTHPRASHIYHPYWNSYINMLKSQGRFLGRDSTSKKVGCLKNFLNKINKSMIGLPPLVSRLHFKYQDYAQCIANLQHALSKASNNKVLYVCGNNKDIFRAWFAQQPNLEVTSIRVDDFPNIMNIAEFGVIFVEANQSGFNKYARYMLQRTDNNKNTVVYVDLIDLAWRHNNITPYLCLLSEKFALNYTFAWHAKEKWLYYKSSRSLMDEIYGGGRKLPTLFLLVRFGFSSMLIFWINLLNKQKNAAAKIENLSGLVLNIH